MDSLRVSYARRTRRGAIRKEVQEKYLRDDLGFGLLHGAVVSAEDLVEAARGALGRGEAYGWVVPDTNVVLHQMDVLEHRGVECGVLDRLVICQTVAEEVRRNDRDVFRRLCASSGVPRKPGRGEGRPITMRFGRHQFAL